MIQQPCWDQASHTDGEITLGSSDGAIACLLTHIRYFFETCRGTSFLAQKIDEKNRLKESISTHKTGLPDKLLKLFAPRPPLQYIPPQRKKPPALIYTGVAQYVEAFATPGDEEYEPPAPTTRPADPRIMRNPELATQSRIDLETKPEK